MRRKRYIPPIAGFNPVEPFSSAEEAWFWFVRCQKAREDGARFESGMAVAVRPCDPDDVYRAVKELQRRKAIGRRHIRVLEHYGLLERPPDRRCRDEFRPFALWDEALDKLATVLKTKDIVQ